MQGQLCLLPAVLDSNEVVHEGPSLLRLMVTAHDHGAGLIMMTRTEAPAPDKHSASKINQPVCKKFIPGCRSLLPGGAKRRVASVHPPLHAVLSPHPARVSDRRGSFCETSPWRPLLAPRMAALRLLTLHSAEGPAGGAQTSRGQHGGPSATAASSSPRSVEPRGIPIPSPHDRFRPPTTPETTPPASPGGRGGGERNRLLSCLSRHPWMSWANQRRRRHQHGLTLHAPSLRTRGLAAPDCRCRGRWLN